MEARVKTDKEVEIEKLIDLLESIEYITQPLMGDPELGEFGTMLQSTYSGKERDAIKKRLLELLKIEV
jgi:hypothetical protein